MSDTVNGFKKIAGDGSSKKFFIFIGVVLLTVVGYVVFAPDTNTGGSETRLRTVPGGRDTTLGGQVNEVYEEALREADRQRIEDAKQQGSSAIPSIIGNKTQEQNPKELTIDKSEPEVVRPGLPMGNSENQEIMQINIPEPEAKKIPTKIELPSVDKPVIQPKPVNVPQSRPSVPNKQTSAQPEPAPTPTPSASPPRPQPAPAPQSLDLQNAIATKMAQLAQSMDQSPGRPETQYFYTPPATSEEQSSPNNSSFNTEFNSGVNNSLTVEEGMNIETSTDTSSKNSESEPEVEFPLPGEILYARMKSRANSDAPGPILAEIVQGELSGTTVIGNFSVANENLVLQFNSATVRETMSGKKVNENLPINAIAVDTKYIGTGIATDVDRHLFERIAVTFGTAFIGGLGELLATSGGTTTTNPDGTTITNNPELNLQEQALSAAGGAVGETGAIVQEFYGAKPTTVIVESGTPIGLLFLK